MGVPLEGRLTAVERRGVAGLFGFEDGEGLDFVGVLSSSSSGEGIACSFQQKSVRLALPQSADVLEGMEHVAEIVGTY
jgi:hypothetical protein